MGSHASPADHMLQEEVGRLPVVSRSAPRKPVGILTRSDLLAAHRRRLHETHVAEQSLSWRTRIPFERADR